MCRKLIIALAIIFIFSWSSAYNFTEAEILEKAPKKPKPEFPRHIKLSPPFNHWNSCDLAILLYSGYNCKNGKINEEELGLIKKVAVWKKGGKEHLVALFEREKSTNENLPTAESEYMVDLAMYGIDNNELKLIAFSKNVIPSSWSGVSYFDLAPYKLNSNEIAVGIGESGRSFLEKLHLFRIRGNMFQKIFVRVMISENCSYEESILQIVSKKSGMNDFKVITRIYGFKDYEADRSKILKITSEIWRWNEVSEVYELSKEQEAPR